MSTPHDSSNGSPFVTLAKVLAIGVTGSALIMGTLAGYVLAHTFGQESSPWVSVEHRACGAYDLAVATPLGMLHARVAR